MLLFAVTTTEKVTLDCEYPASSLKLDVCKLAHIEGDFSNKDVVLNPRIGHPSEIKIKHVHLGRIPDSILRDHAEIKELKIKNGSVYSLEGVSQLKQLEELEMPHNNLSEISDLHLNNPVLEEISLEHNQIETVHPNAFKNTPVLKKVDLSSNKIRSLDRLVIVPTVTTLDLKENLLENIENLFNGNQNIQRIYLTGNHIQKITTSTFADCPSLFKLALDDNKIDTIENGAFDHLDSLQLLQLQKNKLHSFHISISSAYMGNLIIHDNALTELSIKLSVKGLNRKFTLEAQNNDLTEIDLPKTIFYSKIKLQNNPLTQLSLTGLKSADFLYLDNIDLSHVDLSPVLQMKDLTILSLNDTKIGPDAFKMVLQHPDVELIDVSYNPKLANFDFSQFTKGGAKLEALYLNNCGITQVNTEAVKNAFPSLKYFKVAGKEIDYAEAIRIENAVSNKGKPEF